MSDARTYLMRLISSFRFAVMIVAVLAWPALVVRADGIAIWNFNDSNLVVDHGSGTLTTNFNPLNVLFAAGTTNNARLGDPAGQALSLQGGTGNGNNGRNLTFNISTAGFSDITVSFATQGTGTGFNNNQFQYSLDGLTFIDFGLPYAPLVAFGATPLIFNLSSIAGLNNNPNAAFRIVFNGATSSTGTNRIDNFVVAGDPSAAASVPEPTALLLLGSGLTSLVAMMRRRKVKNQDPESPGS
jgi:hypothetical protein